MQEFKGQPLGLIAGADNLPVILALEAVQRGFSLYTILIDSPLKTGEKKLKLNREELQRLSEEVTTIHPGHMQKLIDWFKERNVNLLVMAGKVEKKTLFQGVQPDERLLSLLSGLKETGDDVLLRALVEELAREGIRVVPQGEFLTPLLAPAGEELGPKPPEELLQEMEFGFRMAKEIGRLDIGQTVVVKGGTVLAVEAVEGTNEAILRGGVLGGKGIVVAKVSKPGQDLRFDLPAVGPDTIKHLQKAGAKGLVVETGRTLLIHKEEIISLAEESGIYLWAMSGDDRNA